MDRKIELFIEEQKSLTLCTSIDNNPYCACCFYTYMNENNVLVFKSERKTKHIADAFINDKVAGTITPYINKIGTIQGIQFSGKFIIPTGNLLEKAKKIYYNRYPFALPMTGEIWGIMLMSVKMTDNTFGFGKKLIWERSVLTK